MNYYIESKSNDPEFNLALEQFIFDSLDRNNNFFMLWQNDNSIIVGKYQNTIEEINLSYVKAHNIKTVRRLSGGGAVYHDLGNLNFSFFTDADNDNKINFKAFCAAVQNMLIELGVPAEISGRNDITIDGCKISGNAQYIKQGRVMHHGTLLYDSDLDMLSKALNVSNDKIESKGIKSVRSRVTNIKNYIKNEMPVSEFKIKLKNHFFKEFNLIEYNLSEEETKKAAELKERIYSRWDWNYGSSPPYNIKKSRKIEGCGNIEILIDVKKDGIINDIIFFGDFFCNDEPAELIKIITGGRYEYSEVSEKLKKIDVSGYFYNLNNEAFLKLLFE